MRRRQLRLCLILFLFFLEAVTACSGTKISQQTAPGLEGDSFKKVVVMGLFDSESDRKTFEDSMVRALKGHGCDAVSSLALLGGGRKYSREELKKRFTEEGFEGVLIQRIMGVEEERTTIPENYYWPDEPFAYSWYSFWYDNDIGDGVGLLMRGGYNEQHDIISVESGLFSMKDGKLVWVAHSDTTRVKTVRSLADHLGPKLAGKLHADKLIP